MAFGNCGYQSTDWLDKDTKEKKNAIPLPHYRI